MRAKSIGTSLREVGQRERRTGKKGENWEAGRSGVCLLVTNREMISFWNLFALIVQVVAKLHPQAIFREGFLQVDIYPLRKGTHPFLVSKSMLEAGALDKGYLIGESGVNHSTMAFFLKSSRSRSVHLVPNLTTGFEGGRPNLWPHWTKKRPEGLRSWPLKSFSRLSGNCAREV